MPLRRLRVFAERRARTRTRTLRDGTLSAALAATSPGALHLRLESWCCDVVVLHVGRVAAIVVVRADQLRRLVCVTLRRLTVLVVLAALMPVAAGCGSRARRSTATTGAPTTTVASEGTATTQPDASSATGSVGDRDNGTTVRLRAGARLRVVLSSTYWNFDPSSNPEVLGSNGAPTIDPQLKGCVIGAGCGTVTATFTATARGSAIVTATRTTCGEALACTGSQGHYTITVIVS